MNTSPNYDLFKHMHDEHSMILVESELAEIRRICGKINDAEHQRVVDNAQRDLNEMSHRLTMANIELDRLISDWSKERNVFVNQIAKFKTALTDALPILQDYARNNPRYTALDCTTQDPRGVHRLLEALREMGVGS
jgi:hypothetical protein